LPRRRPR